MHCLKLSDVNSKPWLLEQAHTFTNMDWTGHLHQSPSVLHEVSALGTAQCPALLADDIRLLSPA